MTINSVHRRADADHAPYVDETGFVFRLLRTQVDIPVLHRWFAEKRAAFWLMQDKNEEEVRAIYEAMMQSGHATAYIGWLDGQPVFLAECYDPFHDRIKRFYDVRPGDLGMHIFIGPSEVSIPGFSKRVFFALMRFMFIHLKAERIVVEPDVNNRKIHALNRSAGFIYDRNVFFEEKIASLAFCTRRDFERATAITLKELQT